MGVLRVLVSQDSANSIPRDISTNTWHFRTAAPVTIGDANDAIDLLTAFYGGIDGLLSPNLAGTGSMKVYDLTDSEPRAPLVTVASTFTPGTGDALPNEVAICLSYAAAAISGVSRLRRRGRIYLGPFNSSVVADGAGDTLVDSGAAGAIMAAASTLLTNSLGAGVVWAVFSPTTAGPGLLSESDVMAASAEVDHGYVDNAFDTVRSRGTAPTNRVTFG